MPVTRTDLPILVQFLCAVRSTMTEPTSEPGPPKKLPKGVVLGKDGKPCRSCTSVASWMAMSKSAPSSAKASTSTAKVANDISVDAVPAHCPPDVEALGRGSWNLLHALTATYPARPSPAEQNQTKSFLGLFASTYPCGHCGADFQAWMARSGNAPRVGSRDEFGRWMCEAHNAVNEKLGKDRFDCDGWEERWRTGPSDGSCG